MVGRFPFELLNQSIEEKESYFHNYKILHPYLSKAINKTMRAISTARGKEVIIFVTGPTKVGKKELISSIINKLYEKSKPSIEVNKGIIPVVYTEAMAPLIGSFNWPDFFKGVLEAMNEPLLDHKIEYRDHQVQNQFGQKLIISTKTTADLRRVLLKTLKNRDVSTLIINEAQHLMKVVGARRLNWQLDVVKSFVNLTNTVHVLIGTYELLDFLDALDMPAQLIGRTVTIDFPRYNNFSNEEAEIFQNVLYQFITHLPVEKIQDDVMNDWMYFYKHSIGCIGMLKEWMENALAWALEDGSNVIKMTHFKETATPSNRCAIMLEEAIEGEKKLEKATSEDALNMLLDTSYKSDSRKNQEKGSNKTTRKPGRNPKRDKVGVL